MTLLRQLVRQQFERKDRGRHLFLLLGQQFDSEHAVKRCKSQLPCNIAKQTVLDADFPTLHKSLAEQVDHDSVGVFVVVPPVSAKKVNV